MDLVFILLQSAIIFTVTGIFILDLFMYAHTPSIATEEGRLINFLFQRTFYPGYFTRSCFSFHANKQLASSNLFYIPGSKPGRCLYTASRHQLQASPPELADKHCL